MNYKATALTPILAGDGRTLSPVDYMVWKDQVNVLDQARIFKLLARGPRLEGYLSQLRKATKLDFASWGGFAQNFSQRRIPFEDPGSTAVWNMAPSESLFIPTFASSYRGPYLPASALKGALRTGLIFSRWSAATMERLAAVREGDRLSRRASEAAEASSGASQVKLLSASDSEPVSASALRVYMTRVASLDTRQGPKPQLAWKVTGRGSVPPPRVAEATPLFAEMAQPGTSFTGEWHEREFLKDSDLSRSLGWRSVPEIGTFTEAANKFAGAQLDLHSQFAQLTGLTGLQRTIQRVGERLAEAREAAMTCVLCLGWGTGFAAKAGFLDTAQESYRSILRAVPGIGRGLREGLPFPKTRRIIFSGGQPASLAGWVFLQLDT